MSWFGLNIFFYRACFQSTDKVWHGPDRQTITWTYLSYTAMHDCLITSKAPRTFWAFIKQQLHANYNPINILTGCGYSLLDVKILISMTLNVQHSVLDHVDYKIFPSRPELLQCFSPFHDWFRACRPVFWIRLSVVVLIWEVHQYWYYSSKWTSQLITAYSDWKHVLKSYLHILTNLWVHHKWSIFVIHCNHT